MYVGGDFDESFDKILFEKLQVIKLILVVGLVDDVPELSLLAILILEQLCQSFKINFVLHVVKYKKSFITKIQRD